MSVEGGRPMSSAIAVARPPIIGRPETGSRCASCSSPSPLRGLVVLDRR